jgi:hypothetical protein
MTRVVRSFTSAAAATAAALLVGLVFAADYEANPVLKVSQVLPANLVSGPRFKVDETAPSDGFTPTYVIQSDFGKYEARGREMLEVRVQEISALNKLEEISKGEAFAKAMGQSAAKTGKAVANVATNPVETAKGVPKGVGRFFKGAASSAKKAGESAADTVKGDDEDDGAPDKSTGQKAEGAAKSVAGANKAKRGWAKQYQVDPYSSNPALQKKLDDLALATSAGGFAMKVVNPVAGLSAVATVNGLAWDMPAPDLEKLNDQKLAKMGVADATRKAFFKNSWYTPTQATTFVAALEAVPGVSGVGDAVALATRRARSEDDARFYRRSAQILAAYQKKGGSIASLESRKTLFVGHAKSGALVVPAPVDLIAWTAEVDGLSASPDLQGSPKELWLYGQATDRARAELTARGWTVKERVLD